MADRLSKLSKPDEVIEKGEMWYVTTYRIPRWLGNYLKEEAERQGLRGANLVMVVACTNYFLEEEERNRHNKKVQELFDREAITKEEKMELWR